MEIVATLVSRKFHPDLLKTLGDMADWNFTSHWP